MIEISNLEQVSSLHIGMNFIYKGSVYKTSSEPYIKNGKIGVDVENILTPWWHIENKYDVRNKMTAFGRNIAIQGELIGPKMNGNHYRLNELDYFVFDVFDIDLQRYASPSERHEIVKQLGLKHVPVFHINKSLANTTVDELLKMAECHSVMGSLNHPIEQEGLVFKSMGVDRISFKAISNRFLLSSKN